jgi:hypothetical protein
VPGVLGSPEQVPSSHRLCEMRRLRWGLVAILASCAAPVARPASSTSLAPTTTTAVTVSVPDPALLCNGYLVLLRSGDDAPLRSALDDPALLRDLDTMLSDEGEFAAIATAALRVEQAVVERCAERYAAGTEPASDDTTALERFMTALGAGDQSAGEKVARANVVAQMSWVPGGPKGFSFEIDGASGTAQVGSTMIVCHAREGIVVSCTFAPA